MPSHLVRRLGALAGAALLVVGGFPASVAPVAALSPDVVISQVYGGGGNSGGVYTNDYVELFNRGTSTVSLTGWSVQYTSAAGTGNFGANTGQITPLSGSLAPGQYLLVQEAAGATVIAPLPTPDVMDSTAINMSGTGGKVALVTSTAGLGCNGGSTPCTAAQLALIKDLVGWDGANFYETAAAPATTSSTAILRLGNGCTETDNNSSDFAAGTPTPRNTASPLNPCAAPESAPEVASTFPVDGAIDFPAAGNLSVTFSEPVNVASSWFTLSCSTSGPVTASVSGGPTTFTLHPAVPLADGESCTLTVHAADVSDQDANDPPDNMTADFVVGFRPYDVCAQPYTPIYDIQGSGLSAAATGNVTTKGVVVGDFEGSAAASGFYLQDVTGDGDDATSDGIFVFTGSSNLVSAGQVVRVTGYARERFNQTTLNGSNSNTAAVPAANIVQCGTGSVAATDVSLPFASADHPERYEGMLVRFPQSLVIAEYFNYDRFGEIVLARPLDGENRPFTGTAIDEPGAAANARTLANSLSRITLDDAQSAQNPPTLRHPNGQPFALDNSFRGGDTVQNAVGVLGYDFSLYRIIPTGPADYTATNPRPATPAEVGGTLRVAAMNTLNFFVTPDYPTGDPLDNTCGPLQNVECRGADFDQPDELTRQRDKLIAVILGLDAAVVGLNEIENTTGVEPLADLVAGLNAKVGAGTYAFIDTGVIGIDAIRVGLIYRPSLVTPVGLFDVLDSTVDPRFLDTKNRPALAQTFRENASGAMFTVAVNHLKSKGSDCNDVGDPDTGDGQGNCNITRTMAAQALVDWLATDPTGNGDPDFLILGDLNSYAREDPIDALLAGPDDAAGTADDYTNLVEKFQGAYAYSYVFDGQAGYLDQAASASMTDRVTGAGFWHIDADEPDVLDYDTSFKPPAQDALYEPKAYRASDHDPVVVGLDLGLDTTTSLAVVPSTQQYSDTVTLTATVTPSTATGAVQFQESVDGGATYTDVGSPVAVVGGTATLADQQVLDKPGTAVRFRASFTGTNDYAYSSDVQALEVTLEDATVVYDPANSAAERVTTLGGGTWIGPLTLHLGVKESEPDHAAPGTAGLGDIAKAGLAVQLVPLSTGSPITLSCVPGAVTGTAYAATKPYTCTSSSAIPLGTYEVQATVTGGWYTGTYGDAFTVYDPSLGFATGGGRFVYDGDDVTFGFVMKYTKKLTSLKGGFIAVRHHDDGTVTRLKSNALGGLAIQSSGGCGIATFSGKATYTTWDAAANGGSGAYVTLGNRAFAVRADDCGTPGVGTDTMWVRGPDLLAMSSPASVPANRATLTGGNIAVPHTPAAK